MSTTDSPSPHIRILNPSFNIAGTALDEQTGFWTLFPLHDIGVFADGHNTVSRRRPLTRRSIEILLRPLMNHDDYFTRYHCSLLLFGRVVGVEGMNAKLA